MNWQEQLATIQASRLRAQNVTPPVPRHRPPPKDAVRSQHCYGGRLFTIYRHHGRKYTVVPDDLPTYRFTTRTKKAAIRQLINRTEQNPPWAPIPEPSSTTRYTSI